MYNLPEPPYFLLVLGLFIGLTCGSAFSAILKQKVQQWAESGSTRTLAEMRGFRLVLPYLGICLGICLFLASGVEIFIFDRAVAYAIAFPMTAFIGLLIWVQLGNVLEQLEEGGSEALDLDVFK
ncbi:hypothetical protein [Oscillatoria salina]|uniref:hypothetical protein n=1 Tax=Oscillatoria salina TaxID=331517 RepID=UPI0013B8A0E1|nr:hypothetical protein [Oscillatoria salina]MBZ8179033.1 hypothetical protein [Oscillatoria salina IIICB1]NET88486.1 hypothetical protein [Kamptonema sp. SIO1D9]